jgi:hypothetical protein
MQVLNIEYAHADTLLMNVLRTGKIDAQSQGVKEQEKKIRHNGVISQNMDTLCSSYDFAW